MTRRHRAIVLATGFVVSLLMGVGPGVWLVNHPGDVFGLPPLYAWGILWYLVQVAIAVAAYAFLWRHDDVDEHAGETSRTLTATDEPSK